MYSNLLPVSSTVHSRIHESALESIRRLSSQLDGHECDGVGCSSAGCEDAESYVVMDEVEAVFVESLEVGGDGWL